MGNGSIPGEPHVFNFSKLHLIFWIPLIPIVFLHSDSWFTVLTLSKHLQLYWDSYSCAIFCKRHGKVHAKTYALVPVMGHRLTDNYKQMPAFFWNFTISLTSELQVSPEIICGYLELKQYQPYYLNTTSRNWQDVPKMLQHSISKYAYCI